MKKEQLTSLIDAALCHEPCDTVFINGQILNVFSGEILSTAFGVKDGQIIGFGEDYVGTSTVDLQGAYVVPGLMDAHIHIESTLATPKEFSKAATAHGITSVIMDPHEIGNVLGTKGLDFMVEASKNLPVDFHMMLPSCVPATIHETSGAVLSAKDLAPYYAQEEVSGLAEVMDLMGVKEKRDDLLAKLLDAQRAQKTLDGHGAGLTPMDNNLYRVVGISTDHECTTLEEAKDRLEKGFYVHIREGSVAKNFDALIPLVNSQNHGRFTFCTDDLYIDDLYRDGSIDAMVRRAMTYGLSPVEAIRMATLNPATCYGLKKKGAVAPGYDADFLVVETLEDLRISKVYKGGRLTFAEGVNHFSYEDHRLPPMENTISLPRLTKEDLVIKSTTGVLHAIEIIPNSLLTNHVLLTVDKNALAPVGSDQDLAKLFVIERHGNHGKVGKGLAKGFGLMDGAVATTIAHDSHNLVALGLKDEDLLLAMNRMEEIGGGIVLVKDQKILFELPLDIAGLMSSASMEVIIEQLASLHKAEALLFKHLTFNPFLTLSFLTLPVIPALKITDQGLFDLSKQAFIAIDEALE